MNQIVKLLPQKGMVTNSNHLFQEVGTPKTLINFRLGEAGLQYQSTPKFTDYRVDTGGSYRQLAATVWSTQTAGSAEAGLLYIDPTGIPFAFYPFHVWAGLVVGTALQVIAQITVPAANTLITQCLVVVNNFTGLALTLGNDLDIEIDGAGTFKWQKNGAGYTALVPITAGGVSIDGGNATVYFQTTTGFNVGDHWTWRRTDAPDYDVSDGGYQISEWSSALSGTALYFLSGTGRLYVFRNGGVVSGGYRPVYGTHVAFFEKHLFVSDYSPTLASTTTFILNNSDLNDPDNFFPTDTNEADTTSLTDDRMLASDLPARKYLGFFVNVDRLYVFVPTGIFYTDYLGLPTVFSFKRLLFAVFDTAFRRPVVTVSGAYVLLRDGVYLFNGGNLNLVSNDISDIFKYSTVGAIRWGAYDPVRNEVYFFSTSISDRDGLIITCAFIVYQEKTNTWYLRAGNFVVGDTPRTLASSNAILYTTRPGRLLQEDKGFAGTPLADLDGTNLAEPKIVFSDITFSSLVAIKEIFDTYLDGYYVDASSGYSTTGIKLENASRVYDGSTVTYSGSATWVTTNQAGNLGYPKASGRIFRLRLTATQATNKATGYVYINTLELHVRGIPKQVETDVQK